VEAEMKRIPRTWIAGVVMAGAFLVSAVVSGVSEQGRDAMTAEVGRPSIALSSGYALETGIFKE
jgi:hypothetical protein